MKLPRDLSAADLEKALHRAFGYQFVRQLGSHRRLTTQTRGEHHLTIPNHDPLRPGTLRVVLVINFELMLLLHLQTELPEPMG